MTNIALNKAMRVVLTLLMALSCGILFNSVTPVFSSAVPVDDVFAADASSVLDAAQKELDSISAEYEALSDEVTALQDDINGLAEQVLQAQQAMLDGRSALSATAQHEYRNSSVNTFLDVFFGSTNITELTRNMNYITQIMQHQSEEVAEQKELKEQFTQTSEKLTKQKDEQEEMLAELNQKREEAQAVVNNAAARVQAQEAERIDAMRKQAQSFIWGEIPAQNLQPTDQSNMTDREDVVSGNSPVISNPDEDAPSGGTWQTGTASAYGGSSDPSTPNPGSTATGAVCDDGSMGVAIPMSWPNYSSYFGRTIEISYNGTVVYATINDCGYMGAGARALDLQPGVFKAFGFNDCYAWGVRTVSYRII